MSCLVTSFDRLSNQNLILKWNKCRTNIWWKFAIHLFVCKGLYVGYEKMCHMSLLIRRWRS